MVSLENVYLISEENILVYKTRKEASQYLRVPCATLDEYAALEHSLNGYMVCYTYKKENKHKKTTKKDKKYGDLCEKTPKKDKKYGDLCEKKSKKNKISAFL